MSAAQAAAVEAATREIAALDAERGDVLGPLGVLLLRSESVASSKIERVEASVDDYARALHGSRANDSAASMVAATSALELMINQATREGRVNEADLLDAHAALMSDDPAEGSHAGRLREVQNWVGGSDHSPRNALLVPPPAEEVPGLVRDVVEFSNRRDLPALVQAAIAHAQFETIHPFTDGNGRIGRALVNSILRARGVTHSVVVPLATALVARRDQYFDSLHSYRRGDLAPLIAAFAKSALVSARESRVTADRLTDIPGEWRDAVGRVRRGSAVATLLDGLMAHPIISAEQAIALVDATPGRTYEALARLHDAGVLRPLTQRTRNQVWGAALVLAELNDLGARVAAAMA